MNAASNSCPIPTAHLKGTKNMEKRPEANSPCVRFVPTLNPRVLIIAASPRYVGGQSVMAQRLLADLTSNGILVGFVPVDPSIPRLLQPLERVKYLRTLLRSAYYVLELLCSVPKYDVVHVFSASYMSFLISPTPALLVARLFRKRIVLNYHSGEAEDHLRRSGRVTKWLLGLADRIVVPSKYLVSVFANFGLDADAIANHLNTSSFQYRERKHLHPRIIVARTLDSLYNIPCAIRTFRFVQDRHPQSEMVILGDGPQRNDLENLVRNLNLTNVTFLGFAKRAEMPRLYDEADVFLNTSSIDNMPVSILEAFAAGLPIVSTDAGGIPFLVTDRKNGLLAPVNDHVALAEKLLVLMDNPAEVRRLSRAGREEIAKYDWGVIGPQWTSLYQSLCGTLRETHSAKHEQCQNIA